MGEGGGRERAFRGCCRLAAGMGVAMGFHRGIRRSCFAAASASRSPAVSHSPGVWGGWGVRVTGCWAFFAGSGHQLFFCAHWGHFSTSPVLYTPVLNPQDPPPPSCKVRDSFERWGSPGGEGGLPTPALLIPFCGVQVKKGVYPSLRSKESLHRGVVK